MNTRELGAAIAERRKRLGVDQQSLVEIAGISRHALINIETGKGNPTFRVLNAIADSLGMELRLDVKKTPLRHGRE